MDASLAAAYLLREPLGKKLEKSLEDVIRGKAEIHVPALFGFEMVNIFLVGERRKRLDAKAVEELLAEWETLPLIVDPAPTPAICRRIALLGRRHGLTAYDGAYLELAERLGGRLITLDQDLLRLRKVYSWIM